jgi:hypothetical protein
MGDKWPIKFSQTIRLPHNCWVSQLLLRDASENDDPIQIPTLMYSRTPQIVLLTSPKLLPSTVTVSWRGVYCYSICADRAAAGRQCRKLFDRKHCRKAELFEETTARYLSLTSVRYNRYYVGTLAQLRKATISFVMSACPSARLITRVVC